MSRAMSRAIVGLAIIILTAAASANQIWEVCPGACDCSSIGEAVNLAASGDTINIHGGVYTEGLHVDRPLIIRGRGDGRGLPVIEPGEGGIAVSAGGVTVREIDFRTGLENPLVLNAPCKVFLNDFGGRSGLRCPGNVTWSSGKQMNYRYNGKVFLGQMGNYWAEYRGSDENGDGIGEDPFVIDGENVDEYPLVEPVEVYGIEGEGIYSDAEVSARLGEPFEIAIKAEPGSLFEWMADYDFDILRLDGSRLEAGEMAGEMAGESPRAVFTFTPIHPGKTEVAFVYKRPWENIIKDCRTFEVSISG